jgi:N utilization substance protein B
MPSSSRRRSRILAFQVLFEAEQHDRDTIAVLNRQLEESDLDVTACDFARQLVEGIIEHRAEADQVIERHATAFPLAEMAPVDRNVLRLAIYEVLFDNRGAPLRVAINEAVDIAKGYGSESSGRFVNGVLGAVALEAAERNESANHGSAPS